MTSFCYHCTTSVSYMCGTVDRLNQKRRRRPLHRLWTPTSTFRTVLFPSRRTEKSYNRNQRYEPSPNVCPVPQTVRAWSTCTRQTQTPKRYVIWAVTQICTGFRRLLPFLVRPPTLSFFLCQPSFIFPWYPAVARPWYYNTRVDIDQAFSTTSQWIRTNDAITMEQLLEGLSTC